MPLFAKSPYAGKQITLLQHSMDVLEAFRTLFGTGENPTPLASCWRRFFRLDADERWKAFYRCTVPMTLLHDLGKANSGFQLAVTKKGAQVFRHEHLSSLMLSSSEFRVWLDAITDGCADLIIAAIVGHHLKSSREEIGAVLTADSKVVRFEKEGLEQLVAVVAKETRVPFWPTDAINRVETVWNLKGAAAYSFNQRKKTLNNVLANVHERVKDNSHEDDLKLLIAMRAALIVADSAASGLTREDKPLLDWLSRAFEESKRIAGTFIDEHVIQNRRRQIESSGQKFQWHEFQVGAGALPSRSLLLSACGSGKTLAAWRWIENQLNERSAARVVFLYPTRATATEGFRDYISWAPEADVSLITGTAPWELSQGLFENPEDERAAKDFTTEARLFAIGYWHRRIFSATVDQFLGFMQHSYASMCLLPMLVDSVIVIDEVHSFDRDLFSALKKFLRHFDVPVLCMTASLPARRREELKECGLSVFPQDLDKYPDLYELSEMPRYRVERLSNVAAVDKIVRAALKPPRNAKILWVVNTVARCQSHARRFAKLGSICYHSGFTLSDRKTRHAEVVHQFQDHPGPLLAVTTQVCEMSLDLDADILITEEAPITSLVQRMGRCNRHAKVGQDKRGEVYIYPAPDRLPYSEPDMIGVPQFLEALDRQEPGQLRLQELLEKHGPQHVEPEKYAAFLECGVYAVSREESLRDISDHSVQAILSSDIEDFLVRRERREPVDGYLLPAPRNLAQQDSRLGRYPLVVDRDRYSSRYGLLRELKENV